jgi:hypothetical protein
VKEHFTLTLSFSRLSKDVFCGNAVLSLGYDIAVPVTPSFAFCATFGLLRARSARKRERSAQRLLDMCSGYSWLELVWILRIWLEKEKRGFSARHI